MRIWERVICLRSLRRSLMNLSCLPFKWTSSLCFIRTPLHFKIKSCFWCSAFPLPTTITNSQPDTRNHLVFLYFYHPFQILLNFLQLLDLKNHCFVTRPLGFRFPEQFLICQKWRILSSAVTRQSTCLSCYSVKLLQWHGLGVFFLLKLGPLLEDSYYCTSAPTYAYNQVNTAQRPVANKLSCHNQLRHASRQLQVWSKTCQTKAPSCFFNSSSAQRVWRYHFQTLNVLDCRGGLRKQRCKLLPLLTHPLQ